MFSVKKDKIIFICLLFVSLIGIATGINYQKQLNDTTITVIKKSFEFGLYEIFYGEQFLKIFIDVFVSVLKHFIVFFIGGISWFSYSVIPLNLFGIGFKLGIVLSYVTSMLKLKGVFEFFVLIIILFLIIVIFNFFCMQITMHKINNSIKKNNYFDKEFIYKTFVIFGIMIISIIVIYFLVINIKLNLFGLFKTIL